MPTCHRQNQWKGRKLSLEFSIYMGLSILLSIPLSSSVLTMQMKSYNKNSPIMCSSYNKMNTLRKALSGPLSNSRTTSLVSISLKVEMVYSPYWTNNASSPRDQTKHGRTKCFKISRNPLIAKCSRRGGLAMKSLLFHIMLLTLLTK